MRTSALQCWIAQIDTGRICPAQIELCSRGCRMFNRTGRAQCPERLSVSIYRSPMLCPVCARSTSLRNAVTATRGHIKPGNGAIQLRDNASRCYLPVRPSVRPSICLHAWTFLSPRDVRVVLCWSLPSTDFCLRRWRRILLSYRIRTNTVLLAKIFLVHFFIGCYSICLW